MLSIKTFLKESFHWIFSMIDIFLFTEWHLISGASTTRHWNTLQLVWVLQLVAILRKVWWIGSSRLYGGTSTRIDRCPWWEQALQEGTIWLHLVLKKWWEIRILNAPTIENLVAQIQKLCLRNVIISTAQKLWLERLNEVLGCNVLVFDLLMHLAHRLHATYSHWSLINHDATVTSHAQGLGGSSEMAASARTD